MSSVSTYAYMHRLRALYIHIKRRRFNGAVGTEFILRWVRHRKPLQCVHSFPRAFGVTVASFSFPRTSRAYSCGFGIRLQPVTHRHFLIVASRTLNLSAICTLSKQGLSNKEHTDILQADTKALSALTHSFYLCGSYIWASSQLSLAMSCRPTAKNAQLKLCATTCITHTRP